jgi:RND superfamily putative drug exporter
MKLLGDWNWYLPRWLEWLPRVGPAHDAPPPAGTEEGTPPEPGEPEAPEPPRPAPVPA